MFDCMGPIFHYVVNLRESDLGIIGTLKSVSFILFHYFRISFEKYYEKLGKYFFRESLLTIKQAKFV